MLRRILQSENFLQGVPVAGQRLPGQGAHDIHIDIGKARLPCLPEGLQKLLPGVDPADGGQFPVVCGLEPDAETVDARFPVERKRLPGQGSRVSFHGYLRVLRQIIILPHCLHQPCNQNRGYDGRRTAPDKDTCNPVFPIPKGAPHRLGEKRLHIAPFRFLVSRSGQEITVETFPDTEGDVKI